jgi:hypothetical protein
LPAVDGFAAVEGPIEVEGAREVDGLAAAPADPEALGAAEAEADGEGEGVALSDAEADGGGGGGGQALVGTPITAPSAVRLKTGLGAGSMPSAPARMANVSGAASSASDWASACDWSAYLEWSSCS